MLWFLLEEDKENSLLVTDRPARPPLLLMLLLIRRNIWTVMMRARNCTAYMLLLVRRDPLLLILSKIWPTTVPWNTLLLSQPPPRKPLLCSSSLHTRDVPSESTSETTVNMLSLYMMIFPNRLLLIDKCLFFLEDHPEEKPFPVMSSTCTRDY